MGSGKSRISDAKPDNLIGDRNKTNLSHTPSASTKFQNAKHKSNKHDDRKKENKGENDSRPHYNENKLISKENDSHRIPPNSVAHSFTNQPPIYDTGCDVQLCQRSFNEKKSLHNLNIRVTQYQAYIEEKSITIDERSPFVLKYKTPHFRASATVKFMDLSSSPKLEVGWIQVCTSLHFFNIYGSEGLTSWELPDLTTGKLEMVNDSESGCGPWYGTSTEVPNSNDHSGHSASVSVKMNDNFHPQVTWYIPSTDYDRHPILTKVFRSQSFVTCLVVRETYPASNPTNISGERTTCSPSPFDISVGRASHQSPCSNKISYDGLTTDREFTKLPHNGFRTGRLTKQQTKSQDAYFSNLFSQNCNISSTRKSETLEQMTVGSCHPLRILRAFKWSFKVNITVDSTKARGRRTLSASPILQDQPQELTGEALTFLEEKLKGLKGPAANDCQMLIWRPAEGEPTLVLPPRKKSINPGDYLKVTRNHYDDIVQYLRGHGIDLDKFS